MMKLYHCLGSRSFRALWALEECAVPYDLVVLPFPPRTMSPDYLAINPMGTVPTLLDGSSRMTESAAICGYIAARYSSDGLSVDVDDPAYASYLNFLHMGEATLTFPQTIVFRYEQLEPEARHQPQVAEDYRRWFGSRLKNAARLIEGQEYACGARFTAADISLGYALLFARNIGLADLLPEDMRRYWERLKARPAYAAARAREVEGALRQGIEPIDVLD